MSFGKILLSIHQDVEKLQLDVKKLKKESYEDKKRIYLGQAANALRKRVLEKRLLNASGVKWEKFTEGLRNYAGCRNKGPDVFLYARDMLVKKFPEFKAVNFNFLVDICDRRVDVMHMPCETQQDINDLIKKINEFEFAEDDPDREEGLGLAMLLAQNRSMFKSSR